MLVVYGIRQCDTCRKALKWLEGEGIGHRFHDFRVDGIDAARIESWLNSPFGDAVVNRRSTTWRSLDANQKNAAGSAEFLAQHPTLIKRPVIESRGEIMGVGFPKDLAEWRDMGAGT